MLKEFPHFTAQPVVVFSVTFDFVLTLPCALGAHSVKVTSFLVEGRNGYKQEGHYVVSRSIVIYERTILTGAVICSLNKRLFLNREFTLTAVRILAGKPFHSKGNAINMYKPSNCWFFDFYFIF